MKDPQIRGPHPSGSHRTERLDPKEKKQARSLSRLFTESLKLHSGHTYYYDHGYRSGELHESNLWQIASGLDNARPFSIRESIDIPDFHIGILVDCSGSMSAWCGIDSDGNQDFDEGSGVSFGTIMSAARTLALGMAMSLDEREGVHLSVCGHTEEGGNVHLLMVKRPLTPLKTESFEQLTAQSGNLDGLALVAFAGEMAKDMKLGETGMLVLISDGAPCHGAALMKKAFDICKRQYNLTVFPIGVGQSLARREDICREYYGAGNYVVAADVISAAPRIITKANSLIEELKPM